MGGGISSTLGSAAAAAAAAAAPREGLGEVALNIGAAEYVLREVADARSGYMGEEAMVPARVARRDDTGLVEEAMTECRLSACILCCLLVARTRGREQFVYQNTQNMHDISHYVVNCLTEHDHTHTYIQYGLDSGQSHSFSSHTKHIVTDKIMSP